MNPSINTLLDLPHVEGGGHKINKIKDKAHTMFKKFHTTFSCEGYDNFSDYHEKFEHSLILTKGGLLGILIIVSIVYQFLYSNTNHAVTLVNSAEGKARVFGDASITAVCGILSAMFVIWSRSGSSAVFTMGSLQTYLIVGLILAMFNFAQEASGLNRYLSKDDIVKGEGLYYELDVAKNPMINADADADAEAETEAEVKPEHNNKLIEKLSNIQQLSDIENGGDPFITSISYLFMITVTILTCVYIFSMIKTTLCGFTSGYTDLANTKIMGGIWPYLGFFIELLIVGGLNFIPPLVGPYIRGEPITTQSIVMGLFIMFIAISLQIMFQYSGVLSGYKGIKQ